MINIKNYVAAASSSSAGAILSPLKKKRAAWQQQSKFSTFQSSRFNGCDIDDDDNYNACATTPNDPSLGAAECAETNDDLSDDDLSQQDDDSADDDSDEGSLDQSQVSNQSNHSTCRETGNSSFKGIMSQWKTNDSSTTVTNNHIAFHASAGKTKNRVQVVKSSHGGASASSTMGPDNSSTHKSSQSISSSNNKAMAMDNNNTLSSSMSNLGNATSLWGASSPIKKFKSPFRSNKLSLGAPPILVDAVSDVGNLISSTVPLNDLRERQQEQKLKKYQCLDDGDDEEDDDGSSEEIVHLQEEDDCDDDKVTTTPRSSSTHQQRAGVQRSTLAATAVNNNSPPHLVDGDTPAPVTPKAARGRSSKESSKGTKRQPHNKMNDEESSSSSSPASLQRRKQSELPVVPELQARSSPKVSKSYSPARSSVKNRSAAVAQFGPNGTVTHLHFNGDVAEVDMKQQQEQQPYAPQRQSFQPGEKSPSRSQHSTSSMRDNSNPGYEDDSVAGPSDNASVVSTASRRGRNKRMQQQPSPSTNNKNKINKDESVKPTPAGLSSSSRSKELSEKDTLPEGPGVKPSAADSKKVDAERGTSGSGDKEKDMEKSSPSSRRRYAKSEKDDDKSVSSSRRNHHHHSHHRKTASDGGASGVCDDHDKNQCDQALNANGAQNSKKAVEEPRKREPQNREKHASRNQGKETAEKEDEKDEGKVRKLCSSKQEESMKKNDDRSYKSNNSKNISKRQSADKDGAESNRPRHEGDKTSTGDRSEETKEKPRRPREQKANPASDGDGGMNGSDGKDRIARNKSSSMEKGGRLASSESAASAGRPSKDKFDSHRGHRVNATSCINETAGRAHDRERGSTEALRKNIVSSTACTDQGQQSSRNSKPSRTMKRMTRAERKQRNLYQRERFDVTKSFKPPVFEHTYSEMEILQKSVRKNFVFSDLSVQSAKILLNAFEKCRFSAGAVIIKQGDSGDYFYVLKSGHVVFEVNGNEVGKAGKGASFGELALLYTCPRAATVLATDDCTLFRLDKKTFRYVLHEQTIKSQHEKEELLRKVNFVQDLTDEQLSKLNAVMTPRVFQQGEFLVRRGDAGDAFYVIKEGKVLVKDIMVGSTAYEDQVLTSGEYFGERALVTSEPRVANVVAMTRGVAFAIDRNTFEKVLGSMASLVLRAQDVRRLSGIAILQKAALDRQSLSHLASCLDDRIIEGTGTIIFRKDEKMKAALYFVREGIVHAGGDDFPAGGFFGQETLLLGCRQRAFHVSAPFTATCKSDKVVLGVLSLADCRSVFDVSLLVDDSIHPCQDKSFPSPAEHKPSNRPQLVSGKEANRALTFHDEPQIGQTEEIVRGASVVPSAEITLEDLKRHVLIGEGTFGQVWLVSEKAIGNKQGAYALKIQSKMELSLEGQIEAVIQERNIMSKLNHPFIVRLYKTFQDKYFAYFLLEMLQGGELFSIMHEDDTCGLPEYQCKFFALCIADAIAYMHRLKIAYRDLKPENVVIDVLGYPVIIDFGFAKVVEDKTYTLCGTPGYLPPEVVMSRGHDCSADHWSMGILIYEMLTGRNPFYVEGSDQMSLFASIVRDDYRNPEGVSSEAVDIIAGLLVKDPAYRLGNLAHGERDILEHPWFNEIDVQKLKRRELCAPWAPKVNDPLDTSCFEEWSHAEDKTTMQQLSLRPSEAALFKDF